MGYSPVYSTPFITVGGSVGGSAFLVPAGWTAVVREFDLFSYIGAEVAAAYLQESEEAPGIGFASIEAVGAQTSTQWTGRVVALEGWTINLSTYTFAEYSGVYLGGYLLKNNLP